jgi:hypothetical protein
MLQAVRIADTFSSLPLLPMFHTGAMLGALLFFENSPSGLVSQGISGAFMTSELFSHNRRNFKIFVRVPYLLAIATDWRVTGSNSL